MSSLKIHTPAEQVAGHLREQILRGFWSGEMLGAPSMAHKLGLDHRTVISAFQILERQGLLVPQGVGRKRKVLMPKDHSPPALRIEILIYEEIDKRLFYIVDLQHRLMETGHIARFSSRTLMGMGLDTKRVERYVEKSDVDAWVVFAGSRGILEWFAGIETPAIALAGRRRGIPIAGCGPDKVPALAAAVSRLVALGHRRIVMISREERRKPMPGFVEREFLKCLESHGIRTGPYNLPDWSDDMDDFHRCLQSLFQHSPPTAMVIDEAHLLVAAQQHLAQRDIIMRRDVSMVCLDPSPSFVWCRPSIAHIHWDAEPLVRRVMRWASHVARGQEDLRQSLTKAKFIDGGSVGPAPLRKQQGDGMSPSRQATECQRSGARLPRGDRPS